MKRTVWNGSFEESKKIVTREFVLQCFTGLVTQDYTLYPLCFFIFAVVVSGVVGGTVILWEKLVLEVSVKAHLLQTLILIITCFIAMYVSYLMAFLWLRKKKILSRYYFKVSTIFAILWSCFLVLLAVSALLLFGFDFVGVIWIVIGLTVMILYPFREKSKLIEKLYNEKKRRNLISRWTIRIITAVLISLIFKIFPINTGMGDIWETGDFEFVILILFAPLVPLVAFMFMVQYAGHVLEAFYIAKYYEEYRLFFEFTNEEWYEGRISQERFEQIKAEDEAIKSARRKRIEDEWNRINNTVFRKK